MTEGQVFGARRNPATSLDRRDDRSPNYFLDYAFDEVKKLVGAFPKTMTERVFLVRTSVDTGLQRVADTAVENLLRQYGRDYHASQAAIVVADLDGSVRAMVGGRDYTASQFNRATDALRQPGSSFKPYVYAAALESGMKTTSIVVDGPVCIGNWCPHNYSGGYAGSMSLTQALTRSINTIAVKLSISIGNGNPKAGRAKIVSLAKSMGLRTPLIDTPSLPIGAGEVTVLDHTVAYAAFPNVGKAVKPHALLEVRTGNGEVIWRFDRDGPKPRQVMPAQVALDMNMMMNKVTEEGTARRALIPGVRIAGKTGTTNAYRDAWFVGYSGNMVARRLGRQRRLQLDQPHDRRLAARHDVAGDHELRAPGHRDQAAGRPAARGGAADAGAQPGRREPGRGHRPGGPPDPADASAAPTC